MAFFERVLFGDGRQWICSQAAGDVLEIAIGTGRNLPLYPNGIRRTGVDFSPQMLQLTQRRAQELGRPVDLRLGDAQALDLPDAGVAAHGNDQVGVDQQLGGDRLGADAGQADAAFGQRGDPRPGAGGVEQAGGDDAAPGDVGADKPPSAT